MSDEPRLVHDPTLPLPGGSQAVLEPLRLDHPTLSITGGVPSDPFTLGGRRCVVTGTEGSGVEEVRVQGSRPAREMRVRNGMPVDAVVTPLGVTRRFRIGDTVVAERVTVPRDAPVAIWEWSVDGESGSAELDVVWVIDVPPSGEGSTAGTLRWNADANTFIVRDDSGRAAVWRLTADAEWLCAERGTCVSAGFSTTLHPGTPVRLLLAASDEGVDAALVALTRAADPGNAVLARRAAVQRIAARLSAEAPDRRVAAGLEWAKARLASSYMVEVPERGRSHVSGRGGGCRGPADTRAPRARTLAWTSLAALATGDFASSAAVLRLMAAHQAESGRIPDALASVDPEGHTHAGTAAFLLLAAKHHAWTADGLVTGELWPVVLQAIDAWMAAAGDETIRRSPSVEHSIADFEARSVAAAALRDVAAVATDAGDPLFSARLIALASREREALARFTATSGSERAHTTGARHGSDPVAYAIPILLGVVDPVFAESWLDRVASAEWTATHGVRTAPLASTGFDPASPNAGAVSTAATGWTSWAEYATGRSESAFRHWQALLDLPFERAKGAWDEALHGVERIGIGACPDHALSTAATVWPLVHGVLGADPDAFRGRLRLRPQIPAIWGSFVVRGVGIGDARVNLHYERRDAVHVLRVAQTDGAVPLRLVLEPVVPGGALRSANVDGRPAALETERFGERLLVRVQLMLDDERSLEMDVDAQEATGRTPVVSRP